MQKLNESLWVFEGSNVSFFTMPFSTRMVVVQLADGKLWVHSPIKLTDALLQEIQQLGEVGYLIAPNHLHHLFIDQWQKAFPDALTYGTEEVAKKRSDLKFDGVLDSSQTENLPWHKELDQLLFTGSRAMEECVFFHKASNTLIVTDLVENFRPDFFKPWQRVIAKGVGILHPNGKMPIDWRLSFLFSKAEARQHIQTILSWKPETLIMAHGVIVEENASEFLKRSFAWLTP